MNLDVPDLNQSLVQYVIYERPPYGDWYAHGQRWLACEAAVAELVRLRTAYGPNGLSFQLRAIWIDVELECE